MERLPLTLGFGSGACWSLCFYIYKLDSGGKLFVSDFITSSKFVLFFLDLACGNCYYTVRSVEIMFDSFREQQEHYLPPREERQGSLLHAAMTPLHFLHQDC